MYVVVDIGGTKTRVARSSDLAELTEAAILKTPSEYRDALERFAFSYMHILRLRGSWRTPVA